MPPKLAEIVDEFASAPREVVLEMLLEFSDAVPPLPAELAGHEGMEQVPECQTQFFLKADVQPDDTVVDLLRLPARGAHHEGVRRHPGRGPGRRHHRRDPRRPRRPLRPDGPLPRPSARCGSEAARPSSARLKRQIRDRQDRSSDVTWSSWRVLPLPGNAQIFRDGVTVDIQVWSDVICPWCYIGKRRLEKALSQFPGEST